MKSFASFFLCCMICFLADAQALYFTKSGKINFFSETPVENIEARSHEGNSFLNTTSGELVFSVLIKSFRFEKALMEDHFNEKYLESDQFPKANFKGKILNMNAVNFTAEGEYKVDVAGDLTIHGVTKKHSGVAVIRVAKGQISATSVFPVQVADYNIKIPSLVAANIAKTIRVTVSADYKPYKN